MAAAVAMETDDAGNRLRFQLELEFVQCLANPNYLNFLAQRGYFKDKAFVNYLKYLLYWKEPEYAKYLNTIPGSGCAFSKPWQSSNSKITPQENEKLDPDQAPKTVYVASVQ
uniref:Mediator of RNA polymerase II transcription subunit 31 n=1 Tax=Myotis myotis TaxID=51298 RepID=A0A7J7T791_MYOMY|nr:mediator complex subunit 31 [Myotis myotis]